MNGQTNGDILRNSTLALAIASAVAAMGWGARAAVGVAAGGAWHLVSLWCLTRMLDAWLAPPPARGGAALQEQGSERRPESHPNPVARFRSACGGRWQGGGWLLVKFPLLYLPIFTIFRTRAVLFPAFGVGFTLVLCVAIASLAAGRKQAAQ